MSWPERLSQLDVDRLLTQLVHYLELAGIALAVVLALWTASRAFALWQRRRLAASGTCLELALPERVERPALLGLFEKLAALLRRPLAGASPWIGFALVASEQRLAIQVFCSGGVPVAQLRSALEAALPGAILDEPSAEAGGGHVRAVPAGCVLRPVGSVMLPLRTEHASDPARQILAALAGHVSGEGGIVQLLISGPPRGVRGRARKQARRLRSGRSGSLWLGPLALFVELVREFLEVFLPGGGPVRHGPTAPRSLPIEGWRTRRAQLLEAKASEPLLAASLRLAAFAADRRGARERLRGLVASFASFADEGRLRQGREWFFWPRLFGWLPPPRPSLVLTASEAAVLLPLPERPAEAPLALAEAPARRLAPVAEAPSDGLRVGRADRDGFGHELRVTPEALLRHTHVLGPTGKGKSTLLLNLTLEAIEQRLGVFLLDPKGDLVELLLNRIPAEHVGRVELLDLGDEQHPPALNLLACERAAADRQVEALLAIFRRLFSRYWGPRSEDLLRAALATLLTAPRAAGEPAPTLADVLLLLADRPRPVAPAGADPVALGRFWAQWGRLSAGQREQALAPLANKLRALLGSRALRNLLCQPEAPGFERIIRECRVVLCSLPLGRLGEDAGSLLGSVLVYRLWQTAARLGPRQPYDLPPFLCLVDEFHHFCHLPQGLAAALAEARGYGLGFVLAHQHLGQLREHPELFEAIDANTQTKLCFALPPLDAKRMEPHFAPRLGAADLARLGSYQLACRISHEGRQLPAATCQAPPLPLPEPGQPATRIRASARAATKARLQVEADIARRYGLRDDEPPAQGRGDADSPPPDQPPPYGPPLGPPFVGGPPRGRDAHKPAQPGEDANPDEDQSMPSSFFS